MNFESDNFERSEAALPKKACYTFELTNDQQELLLGIFVTGNYRRREVPYALYSIEGDHFNATLYEKEKHGKRKLCVQGGKAEDFVLFVLEPQVLGQATLGYEEVLNPESVAPTRAVMNRAKAIISVRSLCARVIRMKRFPPK